jgi:hypothetical protein
VRKRERHLEIITPIDEAPFARSGHGRFAVALEEARAAFRRTKLCGSSFRASTRRRRWESQKPRTLKKRESVLPSFQALWSEDCLVLLCRNLKFQRNLAYNEPRKTGHLASPLFR